MQPQEFSELVDNIEAAMVRFESTSNHAVLRAYLRQDMSSLGQSSSDAIVENDTESIFLVYLWASSWIYLQMKELTVVTASYSYCKNLPENLYPWWMRLRGSIIMNFGWHSVNHCGVGFSPL
jgi:hypothetical protein